MTDTPPPNLKNLTPPKKVPSEYINPGGESPHHLPAMAREGLYLNLRPQLCWVAGLDLRNRKTGGKIFPQMTLPENLEKIR